MMKYILLIGALFAISTHLKGQALAFPEAEGFGRFASGGRGGRVIHVNSLADDGQGTLREAIKEKGPRIIVFDISGTIGLESPLKIDRGDVTIAGQSAPGDGICIRNYPVGISADNVIIRFIRFRLGDTHHVEGDAIGARDTKRVIIDHCSMSWATDECASFYRNHQFTMQWCIISEALNQSVHSKGAHGYGGIWGGMGASFHHNLIASNNSRNPRFSGSETTKNSPEELVDFRNNVICNWGMNSIYGGELGRYNLVNNYFKAGPATAKAKRGRIANPSYPFGRFYVQGNEVEGYPEISEDNWQGGIQPDSGAAPGSVQQQTAFETAAVETQLAKIAYELVLEYAGAALARDGVDKRLVGEVRSGTSGSGRNGNGIIDSQNDVGGWPVLSSKPLLKDSDQDGIPDEWETRHGLDPISPNTGKHTLDKQYDDIEVYLNALASNVPSRACLTVAQDGSGQFTHIQDAIDAVPDMRGRKTVIYIKKGVYKEKVTLPGSKPNVWMMGEDTATTIIDYDDFATKKNRFGEDIGTSGSASFFIFADGFSASGLTIRNSAGPVGQAVAARISGDRVRFEDCRFLGFQDTLFPNGSGSRQYYKNCYIEGTTDFIFGSATAFFQSCEINCKPGGHYITAASTPDTAAYGFVFNDCRISGSAPDSSFFLGRPWRPYAKTVFIHCFLDKHIKPAGWDNWRNPKNEKTAYYAELGNKGPGAANAGRVSWSHQLAGSRLTEYATALVLNGWNPETE